jgi:hypothetical protein
MSAWVVELTAVDYLFIYSKYVYKVQAEKEKHTHTSNC